MCFRKWKKNAVNFNLNITTMNLSLVRKEMISLSKKIIVCMVHTLCPRIELIRKKELLLFLR